MLARWRASLVILLAAAPALVVLAGLVGAWLTPAGDALQHQWRYLLPDASRNTLILVTVVAIGSVLLGTTLAALETAGHEVTLVVVPDGEQSVEVALREALDAGAKLILTTGGTGVGPRDRTPEGTRPVLDREVPGLAELLRARGVQHSAHAALSRGLVGVVDAVDGVGGCLVANLPGSPKAVREGVEILLGVVPHVLNQLGGGDH